MVNVWPVLEIAFWGLTVLLVYTYLGYPVVLHLVGSIRNRPIQTGNALPSVSVIIPAYNEETVIEGKIANTLSLEYPKELLDIIVISDASTDRTNKLVSGFEEQGVRLIVNEQRRGKTYGLNRAVKLAKGEILVFTDANAMYEALTVRLMVRNFTDPELGLVTGSTRYFSKGKEGHVVLVMGLYTRFEMWVKQREICIGSCVGADGAVFAMRKSLYRALADTDINDFVLPLDVVRQGYRVVFDPEVVCLEEHTVDEAKEFSRQVRIATRTIRALLTHRDLFNPVRYGLFAWMLFTHKGLRFLFPGFALLLVLLNIMLLIGSPSPLYWTTMLGIAALSIAVAASGRSRGGPLDVLRSFAYMNGAILMAWKRVATEQPIVMWKE